MGTLALLTLRPATLADAVQIARVHTQSWRETYAHILSADYLAKLSVEDSEQRWRKNLSQPPSSGRFNFVAEDPQAGIVGFCSGGPFRADWDVPSDPALMQRLARDYDAEFYAAYILKSHQAQGLGRRMFQTVATELRARGFKSMLVWVLKENPACAYYEKMGGKLIGQTQIVIEKPLDSLCYGWPSLP